MTLKPADHEHVKFSVRRDILKAFDEIIVKHGGGLSRSWLIRQFIQEWTLEHAHFLPNDIRTRIVQLIEEHRGK